MTSLSGGTLNLRTAKLALDTLRHRGPDDEGYALFSLVQGGVVEVGGSDTSKDLALTLLDVDLSDAGWLLGHRRLSVIDLSSGGHQPMASDDRRYWLAFNGEVYNYQELRRELEVLGHRFRTASDTEVVLKAFQEWNLGAFDRFVGMFAVIVVDVKRNVAILARDSFGIKPLYFTCTEKTFACASEVKALLRIDGVSRQASAQRVYEFLRFGIADRNGSTFLEHVHQVPHSTILEVDLATGRVLRSSKHSDCDVVASERSDWDFESASDELLSHLRQNIQLHLRSDVPVGCALSGGIDSNALVALMRHIGGASADLHTISAIFPNSVVNEHRYIAIGSARARATEHLVVPTGEDLAEQLEEFLYYQDEPVPSTSMFAQYQVFARAKKEGLRVMLDGQGGDEVFGGYLGYLIARVAELAAQHKYGSAVKLAFRASGQTGIGPILIARLLARQLGAARLQSASAITRKHVPWLNVSFFQSRGVSLSSPVRLCRGPAAMKQQLNLDLYEQGLGPLLRYEDRSSMAFSVESRVPFLTNELVRFAHSLPSSFLVGDDALMKRILRHSLRTLVPEPILARRDKVPFTTPEAVWLLSLGAWFSKCKNDQSDGLPVWDRSELSRILDAASAGDGRASSVAWRSLVLWLWQRRVGAYF